jgi:hypothetical protein
VPPGVGGMRRSLLGIWLTDPADPMTGAGFLVGFRGVAASRQGPLFGAIGPIGSLNLEAQRLGEGTTARITLTSRARTALPRPIG